MDFFIVNYNYSYAKMLEMALYGMVVLNMNINKLEIFSKTFLLEQFCLSVINYKWYVQRNSLSVSRYPNILRFWLFMFIHTVKIKGLFDYFFLEWGGGAVGGRGRGSYIIIKIKLENKCYHRFAKACIYNQKNSMSG